MYASLWVYNFLCYILPTRLVLLVSPWDFECWWYVFICWRAQKGFSAPPFSEHHPFLNKHTNTLMQIWEGVNQTREMHLHNLLTTRSHRNHYTISQVSSCKHSGLHWKNPQTVFVRRPGNRGRVCTRRCTLEREKEWLLSKVAHNTHTHTDTHTHTQPSHIGVNLMQDQDATESPIPIMIPLH